MCFSADAHTSQPTYAVRPVVVRRAGWSGWTLLLLLHLVVPSFLMVNAFFLGLVGPRLDPAINRQRELIQAWASSPLRIVDLLVWGLLLVLIPILWWRSGSWRWFWRLAAGCGIFLLSMVVAMS